MASGAGALLVDVASHADDVDSLMDAVSRTLRRSIGAGPVFVAPADPVTGAFAGTFLFDIPLDAAQAFSDIESKGRDLGTFATISSRSGDPVTSLFAESEGMPQNSERWREVITPMQWGDELRAVVRSHGHTWGYLCLHREAGDRPFSARDAERLVGLLPAIGRALRGATTLAGSRPVEIGTGVVIADGRGRVTATTGEGAAWLDELSPARNGELPITVATLARLAAARGSMIGSTIITRSGRAAYLEAAPLSEGDVAGVAIAISAPAPGLALARYAASARLTARETEVVSRVLDGLSTSSIADVLSISPHTVQAHLTSVFAKTGVRSRRELVSRLRF
jgi:DNA-binding CsgD family transcriptional regulator